MISMQKATSKKKFKRKYQLTARSLLDCGLVQCRITVSCRHYSDQVIWEDNYVQWTWKAWEGSSHRILQDNLTISVLAWTNRGNPWNTSVTVVVIPSKIHIQNLPNTCQLALLDVKCLKINDRSFFGPELLSDGPYFVLALLYIICNIAAKLFYIFTDGFVINIVLVINSKYRRKTYLLHAVLQGNNQTDNFYYYMFQKKIPLLKCKTINQFYKFRGYRNHNKHRCTIYLWKFGI
jgi:hypothetical protein